METISLLTSTHHNLKFSLFFPKHRFSPTLLKAFDIKMGTKNSDPLSISLIVSPIPFSQFFRKLIPTPEPLINEVVFLNSGLANPNTSCTVTDYNLSLILILIPFFLILGNNGLWLYASIQPSGGNITSNISLEDDLIVRGLPGQPLEVSFKQYSGSITVNEDHERSLFYYFVEAHHAPFSKPLLLWLNGGPGCSSLGVGAMVEHGPFGVKEDGKTLYSRRHSWNKVANILYLESPAGVGFSYSNCSSDYNTTGDSRTARDSYVFLVKWFEKFPHFKTSDFYIAGESYAGFFIPELADTILDNMHSHPSSIVQLKGIMIGNGLMNYATDMRGMYDYIWSHALMSKETHKGLLDNCIEPISLACSDFQDKWNHEMGYVDLSSLNSEPCSGTSSNFSLKGKCGIDPCEKNYVSLYLNLPYVQEALHANKTNLPYPWALCNLLLNRSWWDSPSSMLTIYRKLIAARLRILLYSGDMDGIIPWMSTQYSIAALNLTVKSPWKPWMDATNKVGGYRVEYEGLIFSTVRGAGHEVPRLQPQRALSLLKWFLEGM